MEIFFGKNFSRKWRTPTMPDSKPTKTDFDRKIREIAEEADREFRLACKRAEKRLQKPEPASASSKPAE
jgi:hypothetical protein